MPMSGCKDRGLDNGHYVRHAHYLVKSLSSTWLLFNTVDAMNLDYWELITI